MLGIQFDQTISLGQLIEIGGFIIGAVSVIYSMRGRMDLLFQRMESLESDVGKIADVLVVLGRQDERLNAMDTRLNEITRRTFDLK